MNTWRRIQLFLTKRKAHKLAKNKILCTFVPLKGKPYKRWLTVHKDYIPYRGNTYFLILDRRPVYEENCPIPTEIKLKRRKHEHQTRKARNMQMREE